VLREAFLLQSWLDHLRPRERVTESEPRLQAQIRNLRAVRIESRIILNRSVRSEAAAPERPNFETRTGSAYRKVLNSLDSDNLTKTAVVQLRQRKASRRDEK
jgi:Transmembrane secretion effector